jgi:hypothetical protein
MKPTYADLRKGLPVALLVPFRVAVVPLRCRSWSAFAGGFLIALGNLLSVSVARTTLPFAVSSTSRRLRLRPAYYSITVVSIVSTRCNRLRAFLTLHCCS